MFTDLSSLETTELGLAEQTTSTTILVFGESLMADNVSNRRQTTDIIVEIPAILYSLVALQVTAIVLAGLGNALLLYVFTTQWKKARRNVTVYFIINLAICDFLKATIHQPLRLLDITLSDQIVHHSKAYCQITGYFSAFIQGVSFHSILAISIDRYLLICHPFRAKSVLTVGRARKLLLVIWIFTLLMMVPLPTLFTFVITLEITGSEDMNTTFCLIDIVSEKMAGKVYFGFLFCFYYFIPLLVLSFVYTRVFYVLNKGLGFQRSLDGNSKRMLRSRKSLAKLMLFIAVIFVMFESPYFITFFYLSLGFKIAKNQVTILLIIELLPLICSVLNPVIYSSHSLCNRRKFMSSFIGGGHNEESTFERRETFRSDITMTSFHGHSPNIVKKPPQLEVLLENGLEHESDETTTAAL